MKDYAKFTGELAKGIKIGESSVEVKLLIPLKAALPHLLFLSSNQGEEVNVFLGDPQAAFDFGDEEDEWIRANLGRRVTTDASGVVTNIEKREGEDPNQANLFDQQEGADREQADTAEGEVLPDQVEGTEKQEGEPTGEVEPGDAEQSLKPLEEEVQFNGGPAEGEGGSEGQTGAVVEEVSNEGQDPEGTDAPEEVSKDALEAFILTNRPVYDDIEIDGTPILFPELLQERLELNKTWKEIAQEKEVSPSVLSAKWGAYKKRVERKMMKGGGGAA